MSVVSDKYRGSKEYFLVHSELVAAAQYRGIITYMDVARILHIHQAGHHMAKETGQILGEISEDEVLKGRPMLSALAVNSSGVPGEGFFGLARDLGLLQDDSADGRHQFWTKTRKALYDTWQKTLG